MKATIEVKDRKEADAIRSGLEDPTARAILVVIGLLHSLPSDRSRQRVINYVQDVLNEKEAGQVPPPKSE